MAGVLRFGILGAARIAPQALIAPALKIEGVAVSAIAARDPARAREFAATHGIAQVHSSYRDLIDDPAIDAVYNPLPNSMHSEWSIAALRAGKHVLCEKPISSNAFEAQRMATVARETGLILGEAFHYCYHPFNRRVREILHGDSLGRLTYLEGNFAAPIPPANIRFDWSLAGGATMDLGCYPLHMLQFFSGLAPRVVRARAATGPENIDVSMEIDLELAGGVPARVTCAMDPEARAGASFIARGERGELTAVNPVSPHRGNQLTLKTAAGEQREEIAGETTFIYQLRAFVAAMRGGPAFPTDADAGIVNMRLIDEAYRAAGLPPRAT